MSPQWDIAAYDRFGRLTLIVEVKRLFNKSPEWAAELRSNMAARGALPPVPYFMLVMPDVSYLWKDSLPSVDIVAPTYTISSAPILRPYLIDKPYTAETLFESSLEMIVIAWLSLLMVKLPEEIDSEQQWLLDSGLYAAIYRGALNLAVAA